MIVGLCGSARSGKDTVGNYLATSHGFKRLAFADPLKEACRHIFKFNNDQLYGDLKEVVDPYWGFTPRFALQKFGTECVRNTFSDDVWIKSAIKLIESTPASNWVITDVRFSNEVEAIRGIGGKILKLNRPGAQASGGIVGHPSESSLADYNGDLSIYNDSSLVDLYYEVDKAIEHLLLYL